MHFARGIPGKMALLRGFLPEPSWHIRCDLFAQQSGGGTGMATVIEQIPARSKYLTATFRAATRPYAPFNVSTREPAAVAYWCRHFDTTPERLLEAVRRVGSNPDIVRLELRAF
jgi:hypothetical protein